MADRPNPNSGVTTAYDILGVPQDATEQQIRDSYRNKARNVHPDVNSSPEATALMQAINEAYEKLGFVKGKYNAEARAAYDLHIKTGKKTPYETPAAKYAREQRQKRAAEYQRAREQSTSRQDAPRQESPRSYSTSVSIYEPKTYSAPSNAPQLQRRSEDKGLAIPGRNLPTGRAWQALSKTGFGKSLTGLGSRLAASSRIFAGAGKLLAGLSNPLGWALLGASILVNKKTYESLIGLSAIFGSIGAAGTLVVSTIGAGLAALGAMAAVAAGTAILVISLILFIISTGAYVVPPATVVTGPGDATQSNACPAASLPQPAAIDVRYSSDGKYAYPMAPFSEMYYGCIHWDGELATDMGIAGVRSGGYRPVVAYTSGTIDSAYIDSIGGNAIVLAGDDGRFYYYAHNCALYVNEGQRVTVGEVIATSDTTGSAGTTSNPVEHVHFAIGTDSFFDGGGGEVCPSWDFEQKFGLGRCTQSSSNQCRPPQS